ILKKQRQDVADLAIEVDGTRADAVPAVYTKIHVHFRASGDVDPAKLEKAVALSMEKYCSVTRILQPTVAITSSSEVRCRFGAGAQGVQTVLCRIRPSLPRP